MKSKKLLAVVTAAAMITANSISLMPDKFVNLPVFTANAADIIDSGECGSQGDNLTWTFDSEGTLTISGTGDMDNWFMDYSFNNNPWQNYYDLITTVIIENGVTSIGDDAFYSCDALTSITIPDSVTSIGGNAFGYCAALTSITIPDSVTNIGDNAFYKTPWFESQKENNTFVIVNGILIDGEKCVGDVVIPDGVTRIKKNVFSGCDTLTSITLPYGVTCIEDYAFSWCKSLTSITIPDSITSIGYGAFQGCESLTSITLPNGITNISASAFEKCYKLISILIPDSVTSIGEKAFYSCKSLASITLPNGITNISASAFEKCYKLTSISIPDSVTSIGEKAFYSCGSLTSITIPDSVTSIEESTFYNCDSLTLVTLPDSVNSIEYGAFWNCSSLTSITIPDSVTSIGNSVFLGCESLTSITLPDGVTTIGDYAFENCSSLTSITLPDSVTSIGYGAFQECESLTSITFPNGITNISASAFEKCYKLTSITIPDSVTSIGEKAFYYCESLTSITIPDSVTSIGNNVFLGCESLISINVDETNAYYSDIEGVLFDKNAKTLVQYPNGNEIESYLIPDSVTSIGDYAFYSSDALTSITIPNSVTSIGDYAFGYCEALTSITLPDSVTSIGSNVFWETPWFESKKENNTFVIVSGILIDSEKCEGDIVIPEGVKIIGGSVFKGCSALTSITIPDGVTNIGNSAFEDCSALTSITIPDSVTNIGNFAFEDCSALTSIIIPDSVTSIGNYAFKNCSSLTTITIPICINSITFEGCDNLTELVHLRNKEYTFTDNENNEIIIADSIPVKLSVDAESTYDEITDYDIFGHLDILQEACTTSGEIYAIYGEKDSIVMIQKNESLQSVEIMNEGYTFGAATIGDDDCLYVMWGKSISDDVIDDSHHVENIVISKYNLNGNFIDECGLSVAFTAAQFPFDAGNANIEYSDGIIGVLYDTELIASGGLHHQDSQFVAIDSETMESIEFEWIVTSHSFGVSMIATDNGFAAIERGDANPRGINFTQFTTSGNNSTIYFHSSGEYAESGSHPNDTHTYMGGLAKSASTYAITGKSERFYTSGNYAESNLSTGNYDVFVRIIDRTLYDIAATDLAGENRIDEANGRIADRNVIWLTECNETEKAGNVKIVTLEDGSYCVLWEKIVDYEFDSIQYVILDECGNILRRQSTIYDARLSNTSIQPIVQGDTLTWAVSDGQTDEIIWYTVNLNEYRTEPAYLLGDVNEDGSVDSSDASLVLAEYAKIQTGGAGEFTDVQYKAADVNKDDTVDSSDASRILAYYAAISTGQKPTWD